MRQGRQDRWDVCPPQRLVQVVDICCGEDSQVAQVRKVCPTRKEDQNRHNVIALSIPVAALVIDRGVLAVVFARRMLLHGTVEQDKALDVGIERLF